MRFFPAEPVGSVCSVLATGQRHPFLVEQHAESARLFCSRLPGVPSRAGLYTRISAICTGNYGNIHLLRGKSEHSAALLVRLLHVRPLCSADTSGDLKIRWLLFPRSSLTVHFGGSFSRSYVPWPSLMLGLRWTLPPQDEVESVHTLGPVL